MKALRRIMVHVPGGRTEHIAEGDDVPDHLKPLIMRQELVDEPLDHLVEAAEEAGEEPPEPGQYADFPRTGSVEKVLGWMARAKDGKEARERAKFAWDYETGKRGRARVTLLQALTEITGNPMPDATSDSGALGDDDEDPEDDTEI